MSLSRFAIAGAVLCSLVAFSPTAAHAQPPNLPDSANADGYLYAYNDPELEGTRCRWAGSAGTWGSCENEASSLWNNGYYGIDAVDLYGGNSTPVLMHALAEATSGGPQWRAVSLYLWPGAQWLR